MFPRSAVLVFQDKFYAMPYRRVILDCPAVVRRELVFFTQNGQYFGLLYRVNSEIRLHVKIQFQHFLCITSLLNEEVNYLRRDFLFGKQFYGFRLNRSGIYGRIFLFFLRNFFRFCLLRLCFRLNLDFRVIFRRNFRLCYIFRDGFGRNSGLFLKNVFYAAVYGRIILY